ncbi:CheA signal transduction histidine kinase [Thermocrinis albus DSM 14484]|uniref:Chemotaxis protein CheA n=1 Tax=Thermocrinis albus (strain DSM 14484 / JCM 11386 / HI 11/12) TaxID=638303 RepID=D3SPQ9_THEAH|nr:chemotaxis protein CheA [Thermocrinis albus]ADC89146.1 CheA signal transduction histidine kinase [Thermocrinis albus DSM 14484]
MIPEEMREVFEEFVLEAKEHLEELEKTLLHLEKVPNDLSAINAAFRSMHTIKGGASFLGLTPIVEVAHAAEDVLSKAREGSLHLTSTTTDLLLKSVDFIRSALEAYVEGKPVSDYGELLKALRHQEETKLEERPSLDKLLEKYGLSHLKGRPVEELLEEVVLMPPDRRPTELIAALEEALHGESEDVPEKGEQVPPPSQSKEEGERVLRIDVQKVETLMNLVGELVLERNRLLRIMQAMMEEGLSRRVEELESVVSSIDRIVGDLQLAVMKTRMQPVRKLFQKFPRVVRDLSRALGKEVVLITEGEDTEMDKSLIERLEDPLIHLVRNAVDHGIEYPEERERLGKPREGRVLLKAYYQGDRVYISVEDDGRGIDVDRVKEKALEKGIVSRERLEKLTDKEVLSLIFSPGFSTADHVSEVSGRGVGMDVVLSTVTSFRGTVDIASERGKGTKVVMSFPLTVGIIKSLIVKVGDRLFAIPIHSVLEIVSADSAEISHVSGEEVLILRGNTIPLLHLSEILGMERRHVGFIVVALAGNRRVAFGVDDLLGDEEVVIKPLGKLFGEIEGISGATITGDGSVVLILDPVGIVKRTVGML